MNIRRKEKNHEYFVTLIDIEDVKGFVRKF